LHAPEEQAVEPTQPEIHSIKVATDQAFDIGALNLDGDDGSISQGCSVDLRERGRGNRYAIECYKQFFDRLAKFALNDRLDLRPRNFWPVLLKG
jgi:hypothetical protein